MPWTTKDIAFATLVVLGVIGLALVIVVLFAVGSPRGIAPRSSLRNWSAGVGIALETTPFLAAWLFSVWKYQCSWRALGFRAFHPASAAAQTAIMLLAGLGMTTLYQVLITWFGHPEWLPQPSSELNELPLPGLLFLALILAPIAEETFFRGFVYAGLLARHGQVPALVASALFFSVAHLQPPALIPIFMLGLLLAWLYLRTRSLWPGIAAHMAYNGLALATAMLR